VRQYITEAPLFWLTEYHLDGLRFDAIDQIEDRSARHVLIEIAENIRKAIPDRHIHLTTEDSRNVIFLHPRDENGQTPLFTAEWNDDFHNAAHVFATGETHAYYQDFAHQPARMFARALAEGLSTRVSFLRKPGSPAAWPAPLSRRSFLSTLFRITIRPETVRRGKVDLLAGAGKTRVLLAALLLSPHIPLLFMGEEFGESNPFCSLPIFRATSRRRCGKGGQKSLPDTRGTTNPSRTRTIP
jgi:1,4-alpha-glucan branching enzyme